MSELSGGNDALGPVMMQEPSPSPLPERLWTPWRMRYVGGDTSESGCLFCNRLQEGDDVRTLILHRGERAFVIMNLFPYNTGHVMIVPIAHVASPEDVDAETAAELSAVRGPVLRALRRALICDGFNLGTNVGAVAGAGVTDHVHEHVVPRWLGDANFMPILASTMVLPELIPVTYAKVRAEMEREFDGQATIASLVLSDDGDAVLLDARDELPLVRAGDAESLWRAAVRDACERGARNPEILGWTEASHSGGGAGALVVQAHFPVGALAKGQRLAPIDTLLAGSHAETVRAALEPRA